MYRKPEKLIFVKARFCRIDHLPFRKGNIMPREKLTDPVVMLTTILGSADPLQALSSRNTVRTVRRVVRECKLADQELVELLWLDIASAPTRRIDSFRCR
jgi:hypothetical protein